MNTRTLTFPADENGDVLRRMQEDGDDLSIARDIDFTVVFPSQATAESFAKKYNELGYTTRVKESSTALDLPWDVVVVKKMKPAHDSISEFERVLEVDAAPSGGRNDGWGCFQQ